MGNATVVGAKRVKVSTNDRGARVNLDPNEVAVPRFAPTQGETRFGVPGRSEESRDALVFGYNMTLEK